MDEMYDYDWDFDVFDQEQNSIKSGKNEEAKLAFGKKHEDALAPKHKIYAVIGNEQIIYSCRVNPYVLPVILFSWLHSQYGYEHYVETNLALIQKTLVPNRRPSDVYPKIKETLELLSGDVPDYHFSKKDVVEGFGNVLCFRAEFQNITPTSLLQYYSLTNVGAYLNHFTMIYADEFYYLLNAVNRWNYFGTFDDPFASDPYLPQIDCKNLKTRQAETGQDKSLDFLFLMNLYAYLKMRIQQYEHFQHLDSKELFFLCLKIALGYYSFIK